MNLIGEFYARATGRRRPRGCRGGRADGRRGRHSCETAANGEEALRPAIEKDYDLILLDIMLPDMDGCEVIYRLREARTAIPILFQTGLVDKKDLSASLGVPDCLVRPFNAMTIRCPRETRLPLATRK